MNLDNISTRDHETQPVTETSEIQEPVPGSVKSSTGGPVNYKRESTTVPSESVTKTAGITYTTNYEEVGNSDIQENDSKKYKYAYLKVILNNGLIMHYIGTSFKITNKNIKITDSNGIEIKIPLEIVKDISINYRQSNN